ncbi:hypothetical protein [Paenibacillus roseipurpureus]|uniref:Uncharacterized protein n=1 Tax=Paenibacillus roseopurpureus TaxID=2918901 RepID=A0AA96LR03_9BACL|nr:hypothetical protein [Paenibacillus sp. MBLB1832]WNR44233.1 hypothetical protein MJB10_24630 [Paenibacillus sp. MBLB1832]
MSKHTDEEIIGMLRLTEKSLAKYLSRKYETIADPSDTARDLVASFKNIFIDILDKPHGGTFAPEELAQIILSHNKHTGNAIGLPIAPNQTNDRTTLLQM